MTRTSSAGATALAGRASREIGSPSWAVGQQRGQIIALAGKWGDGTGGGKWDWRSEEGFVISQLVGLIIALLFQVFLVKRIGGSPGKIILRMRITKLDGGPVGYKEAGIRYSVFFTLATLLSVGLVVAALSMPVSEYSQLTREAKMKALELAAPDWYEQLKFVTGLWVLSEIVVLAINKKRRAIHDYMAGTVVIRDVAVKTGQ